MGQTTMRLEPTTPPCDRPLEVLPNEPPSTASTLVDLLRRRATEQPGQPIYTYLVDGEVEGPHLTFGALDSQARAVGALLQRHRARGQRALLLYPAGLAFIPAFFGCLYAGVVAVPLPAPHMAQPQRGLPRLRAIASDARPTLVLTTASILSKIAVLFTEAPELCDLRWLATDVVIDSPPESWQDPGAAPDTLALLQYTSGSTAAPRGVMVSHANLLRNSGHIRQTFAVVPETVSITWLPVFHDMGLTNGIVQPIFGGRQCVLMPPQSVLQRPVRWLQAISRYKATISGGPNFAYDLCARRITPEQREGLDLGSWEVAYNGAEPIRADTLNRFTSAFASCGFRRSSFYPCYGLAEATLIVSGGRRTPEPVLCTARVAGLEHNGIAEAASSQPHTRTLVGCGQAMPDTTVLIVHPETMVASASDEIGEIWVSGPSVARGYWDHPDETARVFGARLKDGGEGPFLRTGDLGFLRDGELFVTGRLKDLIIIGGRNLYPHDIELSAERSHAAVRSGSCVAFSVEVAGEERLIVAAEVQRHRRSEPQSVSDGPRGDSLESDPGTDLVLAIRRAVAEEHDVRVHAVVLLRPGEIPRTPSGKIQRGLCESRFQAGTLEPCAKTA